MQCLRLNYLFCPELYKRKLNYYHKPYYLEEPSLNLRSPKQRGFDMPDENDVTEQSDKQNTIAATNTVSPKKETKKAAKKKAAKKRGPKKVKRVSAKTDTQYAQAKFPRHAVDKALRVPRAILEQNAGKECSDSEAAQYVGINPIGPFQVEIGSGLKYGFLERPSSRRLRLTDLGRKILRPQGSNDTIEGYRQAILKAPDISDVYKHFRGENLPDSPFFENTLNDNFGLPEAKLAEFKAVFIESLKAAKLLEEHNGKMRVLDVSQELAHLGESSELKRLEKSVNVSGNDTCFVIIKFCYKFYSTIFRFSLF